jgi:hypothetical protein
LRSNLQDGQDTKEPDSDSGKTFKGIFRFSLTLTGGGCGSLDRLNSAGKSHYNQGRGILKRKNKSYIHTEERGLQQWMFWMSLLA